MFSSSSTTNKSFKINNNKDVQNINIYVQLCDLTLDIELPGSVGTVKLLSLLSLCSHSVKPSLHRLPVLSKPGLTVGSVEILSQDISEMTRSNILNKDC